MKYNLLRWVLFLCVSVGLQAHASTDYGLYFNSHSVPGTERTSLSLDNGLPFAVEKDFKIEFQIWVRNEPMFGGILHIGTNENQRFHFVFAAGEQNRNFPALVCDEGMFTVGTSLERGKWLPVSLHFRLADNRVDLSCAGRDTTLSVSLHGARKFTAVFGRDTHVSSDVAPVNLRNVKVLVDGNVVRYWQLGRHDGNVCLDEIARKPAVAVNPMWSIDNHIEWKRVYSETIAGSLDVAFNARDAVFYLLRPDKVKAVNDAAGTVAEYPVVQGYPARSYLGHLLYDTLNNKLISYSLHEKISSSLSLAAGTWSLQDEHTAEPYYYNHARAFNPEDSCFYFFGGYGYYQYRNDLFSLNVNTGEVSRLKYAPSLTPRYLSAMGVAGNTLYLFGGRGNRQGRQEFMTHPLYELSAIDLTTWTSRVLWRKHQSTDMCLMASTMYFEPADSSFYAVSMKNGGVLWKISINDSVWETVSRPVSNISEYQDCNFSFYYAPSHHKFYLVFDKIMSNRTHNLSIYSISTPLLNEAEISQQPELSATSSLSSFSLIVGGVVLLFVLVGGGVWLVCRKRKKRMLPPVPSAEVKEMPKQPTEQNSESEKEKELEEAVIEIEVSKTPKPKYFNRNRSSISLLGTFSVYDKNGKNITVDFTPRLKSMLILIILYSELSPQGISWKKATGFLWPDKNEKAARNNRNVTLRRLRMMLEQVGDIELVSENNFTYVQWGEGVFCDYHVISDFFRRYKQEKKQGNQNFMAKDDELLNKMFEILLYGPLLSNTFNEWLDDFKDAYSSQAIDLLRDLLRTWRHDNDMVLRITSIIFLHDPLNEEALAMKCAVLSKQGKKGLAKSVYDRFCKEYKEALNEQFPVPLYDLLADLH